MFAKNINRPAPLAAALFSVGAHAQSDQANSPSAAATQPRPASGARSEALLTKPLAGIDGKEVSMGVAEYPPGFTAGRHRHDANVFVYVLEGSVVMQVAGGEEVTLTAGQTFYESPTDIHTVSRNASATEPAKFLFFFVKDEAAPAATRVE